jgi:hypothetical protein
MKNLTLSNVRTMTITAAGLLLAVMLATGVSPTPATAQHACEPDAHRLCSQFIPNEQDVASCLRRKRGSLSAACRTAMGSGKAAKRAARKKARTN